jgi:hypothetical protein
LVLEERFIPLGVDPSLLLFSLTLLLYVHLLAHVSSCRVPVWLLVGLGARGLVYHAWLGQLMAGAVLSNNEGHLPAELLSWRQHAGSTGSMSSADHDP